LSLGATGLVDPDHARGAARQNHCRSIAARVTDKGSINQPRGAGKIAARLIEEDLFARAAGRR